MMNSVKLFLIIAIFLTSCNNSLKVDQKKFDDCMDEAINNTKEQDAIKSKCIEEAKIDEAKFNTEQIIIAPFTILMYSLAIVFAIGAFIITGPILLADKIIKNNK